MCTADAGESSHIYERVAEGTAMEYGAERTVMTRELCENEIVRQINEVKKTGEIDPDISLLGDKYDFDCNDAVLLCLRLRERYDLDLNTFLPAADSFKLRDIVDAVWEQIYETGSDY